jgi:hypothetical protein
MVEDEEWVHVPRWVPWLPLYRVWGQVLIQRGGSPDRRVVSLREVLANLACKLRRLLVLVWAWLSSRSCGHIMTRCDKALLCRPWRHCRHGGGSLVVVCNAASVMALVAISWFPGASHGSWWPPWVVDLLIASCSRGPWPRSSGSGLSAGLEGLCAETLVVDPIP